MSDKVLTPIKVDLISETPIARGINVIDPIVPKKRVGRPSKPPAKRGLREQLDNWPLAIDSSTVSKDVLVSHMLKLLAMVTDTTMVDSRDKPVLYDPGTARAILRDLGELLNFTGNNAPVEGRTVFDLDSLEQNIAQIKSLLDKGTVIVQGEGGD